MLPGLLVAKGHFVLLQLLFADCTGLSTVLHSRVLSHAVPKRSFQPEIACTGTWSHALLQVWISTINQTCHRRYILPFIPKSCKIETDSDLILSLRLSRLKTRANGHVAGWTAKELPAALATSSPATAASQHDRPGSFKKQCPRADPAPLHAMARHLQGCALLQASLPSQVCRVAPVSWAAHLLVPGLIRCMLGW